MTQQWQFITAQNVASLVEVGQVRCGFITRAAWSPDGGTLGVAHGGGVWLWRGGFASQPTRSISHPDAPIKALAFDPTGQILITGSADTTIGLWMVANGQRMAVLRGHSGSVEAVALNTGGTLVASGSADTTVRLLNLNETMQRMTFEGHADEVTGVVFIGSTRLASASRDATIRLWDINTAAESARLTGHTGWIRALALNPVGDTLASASRDGTIRLWDTLELTERAVFTHDGDSRAVAFSPDGALVAADDGGTLRLWDAVGGRARLHSIDAHDKPILTLAFHPAGTLLVSGGGDNVIRLWGVPV
jgi:WD40 repeat protein